MTNYNTNTLDKMITKLGFYDKKVIAYARKLEKVGK